MAYLPEAGLVRLINAIRQGLPPNLLALRDFVHERDPQVANRTMDPFVAELKSLTRAPSNRRAARIYRRVVQVNGTIGMFILKALDKWSVLVGWKAVYDNVYAKTQKEAEAIEAARRATIRTQPSGRAKDLPELYVNRAMRWLLIFTTPINRFRNMLAWCSSMCGSCSAGPGGLMSRLPTGARSPAPVRCSASKSTKTATSLQRPCLVDNLLVA